MGLPMNLTMASLSRSVRVRRSKASSSSLAMAAILNCVGFLAIWSMQCFIHESQAHPIGFNIHPPDPRATECSVIYLGLAALVCVGASVSAG